MSQLVGCGFNYFNQINNTLKTITTNWTEIKPSHISQSMCDPFKDHLAANIFSHLDCKFIIDENYCCTVSRQLVHFSLGEAGLLDMVILADRVLDCAATTDRIYYINVEGRVFTCGSNQYYQLGRETFRSDDSFEENGEDCEADDLSSELLSQDTLEGIINSNEAAREFSGSFELVEFGDLSIIAKKVFCGQWYTLVRY